MLEKKKLAYRAVGSFVSGALALAALVVTFVLGFVDDQPNAYLLLASLSFLSLSMLLSTPFLKIGLDSVFGEDSK